MTTIGYEAFYNCSSITSITIPNSVTTIVDYAFYGCDGLMSVYCKAITPPSLGDNVFTNGDSNLCIYVPAELVEVYMRAEGWRDYADAIVGYDFENGVVVE